MHTITLRVMTCIPSDHLNYHESLIQSVLCLHVINQCQLVNKHATIFSNIALFIVHTSLVSGE